jgi:hypothetical protein
MQSEHPFDMLTGESVTGPRSYRTRYLARTRTPVLAASHAFERRADWDYRDFEKLLSDNNVRDRLVAEGVGNLGEKRHVGPSDSLMDPLRPRRFQRILRWVRGDRDLRADVFNWVC